MCRNQFITAGMGSIIDINLSTVIDVMKLYPEPIVDPWACLNKVKYAFHENVMKKQGEGQP